MNKSKHQKIIEKMIRDRNFRINLSRKSHYWFFHFYFAQYVSYETADFQREMFRITEDEKNNMAVIVAFRGSAKSTIFTLSYVLWSILGRQNKKFVIILSQTQKQARQHLMNIRTELEKNGVLSKDLGPFKEESDEWGGYSLVISNYGARISAASNEQSIRGIKHLQFRPQVIIADDVEDLNSVKTQDSRDKTYNWFKGDVIPAGDANTKTIVIGNLLHEDSLLKRLQKEIENKELSAIYKEFPLLDEKGYPLWPDKFPTENEINKEKMKVGNEIAWQREYLLHIISEAGRVVYPEWIHYYDPDNGYPDDKQFVQAYAGVDLAISEKENADYTAIVVMRIYEIDEKFYAYVMPFPVNKRIGFPDQVNEIKLLVSNTAVYRCPKIFVEKVAYQESIIQHCQSLGIQVEGIPPHGEKRERIVLTTAAIKEGLILFPNKGAEDLVSQLTNFGTEKYNDLADAFAIAANQFIAYASAPPVRLTFL